MLLNRVLAALLLAAATGAPACAETAPRELFAQIGSISRELEAITHLKFKHPVPSEFISKAKVNEFLRSRIKQVASPAEIRAEELTLKKFGLIPQDFDLAGNTVELLTEQAAAFYDYNRKRLYVTESSSPESQEPVLIHELAHALADQHFRLARFIRQGRNNDDGSSARLAVMEGQASWLMAEVIAKRTGQSLTTSPALLANFSRASDSAEGQYPVLDRTPLYLRQSLVFPYTRGLMFQHALFLKTGTGAFAEVFAHPPVSTQQILHPELYAEGRKPTQPAVPEPDLPRGYKSLVGGTLGELDVALMIEQFSTPEDAAAIAPHWRGSQFELRENKRAGRVVLLFAVEWDDEKSAIRFFDFYAGALGKKWKQMHVATKSPTAISGTGDDGRFELRRTGAIVTTMEGLEP